MGSWNATCHLSNLSIMYGDPVVVIPVIKKEGWEAERGYYNYNPNSCFTPFLPPIHNVQYADYGKISIISDQNNPQTQCVLECIKSLNFIQSIKNDKNGMPEDHIISFESIEDFISKVERSGVEHKPIYVLRDNVIHKRYKVDFVMYHADIYNGLINAWKKYESFDESISIISNYFDNLNKDYISSDTINEEIWNIRDMFHLFTFGCPNYQIEYINSIVELNKFSYILTALRKGYMCITGCGSQSTNIEFNFLFNELVRKHLLEAIKEELYNCCEDEEFIEKHNLYELDEISDDIAIEYMLKHQTDRIF